jgi:hypothetical protein
MVQFVPVNPDVHEHVYVNELRSARHEAPFWQGFDRHGLSSVLENSLIKTFN